MKKVNQTVASEKDFDALLGAFFKAEMPREWPAFQPPRRTLPFRPAQPRRKARFGSRLALVASVALLTLCGWLLSGTMSGPMGSASRPMIDLGGGKADSIKKKLLLPELPPLREPGKPGKVNSKIGLEQGNEGTTILIEVDEVLPGK